MAHGIPRGRATNLIFSSNCMQECRPIYNWKETDLKKIGGEGS